MPNDMYTLKALSDELSALTVGGRIEKINQPEKDEFVFYIHNCKNYIMVVSVNPNCPRIHITNEKKDNPYVAPSFLMLLRKKLCGSRIESFSVVGFDRIIKIDFRGRNEMADEVSNTLYVELLGRYSNVILVDDKGTITEALRHIYPENSLRCVLPKVKYELPPNEKLSPLETEQIKNALLSDDKNELAKKIISNVSGFSLITARELCFNLGLDYESKTITQTNAEELSNAITELYNVTSQSYYRPCYTFDKGGEDFFVFHYKHLIHNYVDTPTLNEAVKVCSLERDRKTRLFSESKAVANAIKNSIKKNEKALSIAKQKVIDSQEAEKLRILGEILINNLYKIKKGTSKVELYNYYDDTSIVIALDPLLTPEQNAQSYFKKYSKAKRTLAVATKQVEELQIKLDYLYSLKAYLELCTLPQEIQGIKEEAIREGILEDKTNNSKTNRNKKSTALPPKEYLFKDYKIIRGRNNIDNEKITFHIANDNDLWLHVKDFHGSHVIIKSENKAFTNEVIQIAAEIAGYYSEGVQSFKLAIDYTECKFVKKNPSGAKGAVTYTNYKTAFITPNPHTELEINK